MSGTLDIKRRIKSVKSTKKITKAMELVAASKMKRAVSSTLASRAYAQYSWEVLESISNSTEKIEHPLFVDHPLKNILVLLITSNRGLCGAYNAHAIKKTLSLLNSKEDIKGANIKIVAVGKKGDVAMRRVGMDVLASFFELPDNLTPYDVTPIAELLLEEYMEERCDKVYAIYTDFISALAQKPHVKQILPVSIHGLKEIIESLGALDVAEDSTKTVDYVFDGDREKIAGVLARKLTKMQIYQMLLESNASEQSARMVAMKNASEASTEMIEDLTLAFNKARQASITKEISEISAGMASVG